MVTRRKIYIIATDSAGCFHYRLRMPLTRLDPNRFQVVWQPWPDHPGPGDIVLGQRIAGDSPDWLTYCSTPGIATVYDMDDNLLDLDPENTVPYSIFAPQREGTAANIAAASIVTVTTLHLAAQVLTLNPNVVVLPNCLEASWYAPVNQDHVTVGWAGSFFHHQDFGGVAEQLQMFWSGYQAASFHTIGADYFGPLPNKQVSPWAPLEHLPYRLSNVTVGIAPLVRTPFNMCKSHIKVLEYAGKGIPAVASDVGQYPEFIEHGVSGFLIPDVHLLADRLMQLTDYDLRKMMAKAAFESARKFEIGSQIHRWEQVYSGV